MLAAWAPCHTPVAQGWSRPLHAVRDAQIIGIHLLPAPPSWHPTRPPVFRRELLFQLLSLAAKTAGSDRLKQISLVGVPAGFLRAPFQIPFWRMLAPAFS